MYYIDLRVPAICQLELQMRLGDYDTCSIERHVRQYLEGLPDRVETIIVTNTVTNPDVYKSLNTGETMEQLLELGNAYLAATASAHPTRAWGPESGPKKRRRVPDASVRQGGGRSTGGAARPGEPTRHGPMVLRDTNTPTSIGHRAYHDPEDPTRIHAPRLKHQLKEQGRCFYR